MKRSSGLLIVTVVAVTLLLPAGFAFAQFATNDWSGDGQNRGGSGTWDTINAHWGPREGNGPWNIVWNNATMSNHWAQFAGSAGTVTVQSSGISCRRIRIHTGGYVLEGGTITFDTWSNQLLFQTYHGSGEVTIKNNVLVTTNGNYNVRIRPESGAGTLTLSGSYQLGTASGGTRWFDLESVVPFTINFSGALLNTAGSTIRLRFGNTGTDAVIYNISGNSTYANETHLVRGTVNVLNPNALGGGGDIQLATSATSAGNKLELFFVGDINIANKIKTASGGTVTAVVGKGPGDVSTTTLSGNLDLNVDSTKVELRVTEAGARLNITGWVNDGTGTRGIVKTGAGVLALNRSIGNDYDGGTIVSNGTLLVNNTSGSGTGTGPVTIVPGATLGGTGRIGGNTTVSGTLAPGESPGTLTFDADLTLASTATLAFELNGQDTTVGGGVNDLVVVGGNLTLAGTLNVTETVPGSFMNANAGDTWRLFNYSGSLTDNGLTLGSMPSLPSGWYFQLDTATSGQVNLKVIPEPGTIWLILSGLGMGVLIWRRRR